MNTIRYGYLTLLILYLLASPSTACIWDSDTLRMERERFPDAFDLIRGKFLRHSDEYYRWRIEDRTKRLKTDPDNLALYDDLAVAYDKTGQHVKAIETILLKDRKQPGLYESYANLGTFYIHSGNFEEGLKHIQRAIDINPDAHFGREIYQKLLVEYVLTKRVDGKIPLPMSNDRGDGFNFFVIKKRRVAPRALAGEIHAATKGVLGMMRFGHHDAPVLLEALGNLLRSGDEDDDAKRLAARAYLKASYEVKDEESRHAYRSLATQALEDQSAGHGKYLQLTELETKFKAELKRAESWYADVRQNELQWIELDKDVDREFTQKYYSQSVNPTVKAKVRAKAKVGFPPAIFMVVFLLICIAALVFVIQRSRRLRPLELDESAKPS